MVKEELCEKVVEVRVMTVVFEEDVLRFCGYAPQRGRSLDEKQSL